jgi:hypothetical protein
VGQYQKSGGNVPEVQSQEEFEHYHSDGLKNIRLDEAELAAARQRTNLGLLDDALQQSAAGIREDLSATGLGPEQLFKLAMRSLKESDINRFLIENALEALKRGGTYADILKKYTELGFVSTAGLPPSGEAVPQLPAPLQATIALLERKSIWERFTTSLAQIAVNAVKSGPKWVEIEPEVGFVGPVPTLSFHLKAKGMSAYEFFEALRTPGSRGLSTDNL